MGVVGEEPSPPLRKRIHTAYDYLLEHPNAKVIATGGLGNEENLSEGECIEKELSDLGISKDRILIENQSSSTWENMKYSYRLLNDKDVSVGIVTSNFHVYRSVLSAKSAGFKEVYGIAAPFSGVMIPHYMVREFMTFTVDVFLGNIRWEF